MIPDVGWMIGTYIITQMAIILLKPKEDAHPLARMLAGGTIAFCLFAMYDILQQGVKISDQMK